MFNTKRYGEKCTFTKAYTRSLVHKNYAIGTFMCVPLHLTTSQPPVQNHMGNSIKQVVGGDKAGSQHGGIFWRQMISQLEKGAGALSRLTTPGSGRAEKSSFRPLRRLSPTFSLHLKIQHIDKVHESCVVCVCCLVR